MLPYDLMCFYCAVSIEVLKRPCMWLYAPRTPKYLKLHLWVCMLPAIVYECDCWSFWNYSRGKWRKASHPTLHKDPRIFNLLIVVPGVFVHMVSMYRLVVKWCCWVVGLVAFVRFCCGYLGFGRTGTSFFSHLVVSVPYTFSSPSSYVGKDFQFFFNMGENWLSPIFPIWRLIIVADPISVPLELMTILSTFLLLELFYNHFSCNKNIK